MFIRKYIFLSLSSHLSWYWWPLPTITPHSHISIYIYRWMAERSTGKKCHQCCVHSFIFVHVKFATFFNALVKGKVWIKTRIFNSQADFQRSVFSYLPKMDSWTYSPHLDWWQGEVPLDRKFLGKFYLGKVLSVERSRFNTQQGQWDLMVMPEEKF